MAANLTVPKDVTKLYELKETNTLLYRLLTDITAKCNELEQRVAVLEGNKGL